MWRDHRHKCDSASISSPMAGPRQRGSRLHGRLALAVGGDIGRLAEHHGLLRAEDRGAEPQRRVDLRLPWNGRIKRSQVAAPSRRSARVTASE
jgi:hypothetical protein